MQSKRGGLIGGGIVVVVVVVGVALWFGPLRSDDAAPDRPGMPSGDPAAQAADAFAENWASNQLGKVPVTEASGKVDERTVAITLGLGGPTGIAPSDVRVTAVSEVPDVTDDGGGEGDAERRRADLEVSWTFDGDRVWTYETAVDLVESEAVEGANPVWLVDWKPAAVHPSLVEGEVLRTARVGAKRGEVLGSDGAPIVGLRPVVQVGIQPGATTNRTAAAEQVAGIVGVDGPSLVSRVTGAGPDSFVSVITLRQDAFEQVRGSLSQVAGVVLREDEIPLAPSRNFARALLGSVGPASEEIAAASGGTVEVGEYVGLSGLQSAQDEALGGLAGLSIRAVPMVGDAEPRTLQDFPAEDGASVTITLDTRLQLAADEVMANASGPAALVAIRPSTGDVLAVSNGPTGSDGYNRAMIGSYPPGSTFKVASTMTLLENGLTPDTPVDCPATIVVGKEFKNAENEVLGTVPFRKDFADSCNTAFVAQSREITAQQLTDTAELMGFRELDLGVPVIGGSVPVTDSVTEHAANMIGQGKVTASPFTVALMSASVAAGRSVEPRLIVPADGAAAELGAELPAEQVAQLQDLMRGVVTDGTGSALANVPGGEVFAKTGTAEYGTESPPRTHAWITGFQGDVAFAVVVEDGGFGGSVAAPLAAEFLTKIAS